MMYGVWNRKNNSYRQELRYFKSFEEADNQGSEYIRAISSPSVNSDYWDENLGYEVIEYPNIYPIDYLLTLPVAYIFVDSSLLKEALKSNNNKLKNIDNWPLLDDLYCVYKDIEDMEEDGDSDLTVVEFHNGKVYKAIKWRGSTEIFA